METEVLWQIIKLFASLSVISFGGGLSVIPEMHMVVVDNYHWMSTTQFVDIFAITQATPGPSTLVVSLVGYKAGGWWGLIAATLAMFLPACVITFIASHFWDKFNKTQISKIITNGLAPVTLGLLLASALIIAKGSVMNIGGGIVAVAALILFSTTKINPLYIMAAAGLIGWLGLA